LGKPKNLKNCENKKKIANEEAGKKNYQTQLKTTGRNVEGEKIKHRQSSKKCGKYSAESQR